MKYALAHVERKVGKFMIVDKIRNYDAHIGIIDFCKIFYAKSCDDIYIYIFFFVQKLLV